ncbi:MAG: type II secretion system F family protein [Alphaproteobacteria bacterium]
MNIGDFIPSGFTMEEVIVILAGVAVFSSVLAVWYGLLQPRPMTARIRSLDARRSELRGARLVAEGHPLRARGLGVANLVVHRLKLLQSGQAKKIGDKLARAGWRSKDALIIYLAAKVFSPLFFGVLAVFLIYVLDFGHLGPQARMFVALGAVLAGAYAPEIATSNSAKKRQKRIEKAMPDGLDLMVICAEAGLSLDASLARVGRELNGPWPELADEFSLTSIELSFVPERRQALQNLVRRVPQAGLRALVNTLIQTERYGTPLAVALRVLSSELRNERLMKAEEKAARLPAIMTVPMIIFILPSLFVVLLGPAAIGIMDNFTGVFR